VYLLRLSGVTSSKNVYEAVDRLLLISLIAASSDPALDRRRSETRSLQIASLIEAKVRPASMRRP